MVKIIRVESAQDLEHIRTLFKEYADSLGFDLDFQDFQAELDRLPGDYTRPGGCLLLAKQGSEIIGCVALRKIDHNTCEMKRLYVRPHCRGKGTGRALSQKIIDEARTIGYKKMRLDTIPTMKRANVLYRSFGFKKIKPYRYNPIKGALFMELDLRGGM
ncbi:acetyltransferase [candidate division WOR_3 bacterium SM23_60]|uniref:Acetyltransferase n=1 Tax=candidate division WOR_3 bacterium SM23_60 TaxID=1703780 RepID=A0A0S8GEF9_UNCW3|nr:MAG: acetyltransferase [candidate division WOR_3 bacterium SM23_60]